MHLHNDDSKREKGTTRLLAQTRSTAVLGTNSADSASKRPTNERDERNGLTRTSQQQLGYERIQPEQRYE